jgi:hypothetical protein
VRFGQEGSTCRLDGEQQEKPKAWIGATLPRTTRQAGAFSAKEFCGVYESHSGLIALLHRLGFEYHTPEIILRRLDEAKPKAFIAACEKLGRRASNPRAPAAGRRAKRSLRPCGRAGAGALTFTTRLISQPGRLA